MVGSGAGGALDLLLGCRTLDFETAQGWVSIASAFIPDSLDALIQPGTEGTFFFVRWCGRTIFFGAVVPEHGAASSLGILRRMQAIRFALAAALLGASPFLYARPGMAASSAVLVLLGGYNLARAILHSAARADGFLRGGLDLPQP